MVNCSAYSTACTTVRNDTIPEREALDSSALDSVQKLIPIGFYVLSERGARKSIKASIDAVAYFQKWKLTDESLAKMATRMGVVSMQRNMAIDLNRRDADTIKTLKRELKGAKFWKYAAIIATGVLGTKLLIKSL